MRACLALLVAALAVAGAAGEATVSDTVSDTDTVAARPRPPPFLDPALVPAHDSPVHLDTPPLAAPWPRGGPVAGSPRPAP